MKHIQDILPLLACADCGTGGLLLSDSETALHCPACGRDYEIIDQAIISMLPRKPLPAPRMYADKRYQYATQKIEGDIETLYYSKKNKYFSAVHLSTHRILAAWFKKYGAEGTVLDLGCGTGDHFPYFQSLESRRIFGLDSSLNSLQVAHKRNPEILLIQGDIYNLPFITGAFNSIFSLYNYEHLFYLPHAIMETSRILNDQGRLYMGLPTEGGLGWTLGRKIAMEPLYRFRYDIDYPAYMRVEHCNTYWEVVRKMRAEFICEKERYFPFSFLPFASINATVSMIWKKIL